MKRMFFQSLPMLCPQQICGGAMAMLLLASLVWHSQALAHTALKDSFPADGAALAAPPESILLTFNGPVRLLRFELFCKSAGDDSPQPHATNFFPASVPAHEHQMTVATEHVHADGSDATHGADTAFTMRWAAMGADGHVLTGDIRFSIDPQAAPQADPQADAQEATP